MVAPDFDAAAVRNIAGDRIAASRFALIVINQ
jgi:hypothetical protein